MRQSSLWANGVLAVPFVKDRAPSHRVRARGLPRHPPSGTLGPFSWELLAGLTNQRAAHDPEQTTQMGMDGQTNLVGQLLAGRYKLLKLIGQGGMGAVYQGADQQMSNRIVAVKVLAPHLVSDEKQVLRFEQEARAATQLRHPNTISVLDFGQSDGHIFMVIEFLTGETLTQVLRKGRIDASRALYMMRQVCKSLAEAHSKGIIHRDLKPDNIFVCEIYGEKDFIKVIDFGIAKFLEAGGQELTQAGKMFGTPRYLSPEQAQGLPLTPASDLYALGVILFEMLAGRPPFVAEDPIAVAIKHVQEAPPAFHDVAPDLFVPEEVDGIVFKLLSKKAIQRYQSSEEVVAAIDESLAMLTGNRHPSGQFNAVSTRTPARPKTIPPPSRGGPGKKGGTVPPPSAQSNGEEATRALDSLQLPPMEAEKTMALDSASVNLAPSNERTLALDSTAAQAAIAQAQAQAQGQGQGDRKKAEAHKTDKPAGGQGVRNLVLLLIVAVLAVGAVLAMSLSSSEGPKPVQVAQAASVSGSGGAAEQPATETDKPVETKPEPAEKPEEKPAEPTPPPTPPPPAPPPVQQERSITLKSSPDGATVVLDGLTVGKTPFPLKVRGDAAKVVLLKLDDFEDYKYETNKLFEVAANVPEITATLKAKPKKAPGGGGKKPKLEW